jgi:hypothetical protein
MPGSTGLGNGHAAARRVQPDDVAHQHVAAESCPVRPTASLPVARVRPDQRGAHRGLHGRLGLVQR